MNPRHPRTSLLAVLGLPALLFTTVAVVWAAHNRLAAAVIVGGLVWIGGLVAGVAAWDVAVERGKRIAELTEENAHLDAEVIAAETEARIANDLLARYRADARVVIPIRRGVPVQRGPEHDRLAMSREEWAAIERETRDYQ